MGPVVADWDSDGEGPLQQTQNAIAGNGLSKRRDSVSDSPCVNCSSCQKHMKEEVRRGDMSGSTTSTLSASFASS